MSDRVMPGIPVVKINGRQLDPTTNDRIHSVVVDLSMHRTSTATITLNDPFVELLDADDLAGIKVGTPLTVAATTDSAMTPTVFTGAVTGLRVAMAASDGGGTPQVEIVAHTGGHRLRRQVGPVSAEEESVKQIVTRTAEHAGLSATVVGGRIASATSPHTLPTGTVEQLLDQLASIHGADWWTDGKEIRFEQREQQAAAFRLVRGNDFLAFDIEVSGADVPSTVAVHGSTGQQQDVESSSEARRIDVPGAVGSSARVVEETVTQAASAFDTTAAVRAPVADATSGKALADNVHARMLGDVLRLRVTTSGTPEARVGMWVGLDGLGTRLSGDYRLTGVRHVFDGTLTTELHSEPPALTGDGTPDAVTPSGASPWSTSGPVLGIVTDIEDPESRGRVLVRFPSLGDKMTSTWARVTAPGAGPGRGLDLRPAVGDEVLVLFQGGDPSRAVIIGGLWSEGRAHANSGATDQALKQSQSLRGHNGGALTFHGSDGGSDRWGTGTQRSDPQTPGAKPDGGVSLVASSDVHGPTLLLSDRVVLHATKNGMFVGNDKGSIELDKDGRMTITCEQLEVKAKSSADIAAQQKDVTVKAGGKVLLKGRSAVEADGLSVTVKGTKSVDVKTVKMSIGP